MSGFQSRQENRKKEVSREVSMTRTLMLLIVLGGALVHAQDTNTPFQHVIVLIQENRTLDNLFGSDAFDTTRKLPDADLAQHGECHGNTITLGNQGAIDACFDPRHDHNAWNSAYDAGAMDRFCDNPVNHPDCVLPPYPQYQYVDNTPDKTGHGIVDPYFHIAENYGFANYMFQTNQGNSFPAHQFLFSGTSAPVAYPDQYYDWLAILNPKPQNNPAGCVAGAGAYVLEIDPNGNISKGYNNGFPCYDHNTLADLLDNNPQPIGWRHYGPRETKGIWTAPNAIQHLCVPNKPTGGECTGPIWKSHVVADAEGILTDLGANPNQKQCDLQPMSWVVPDGNWSDHPGDKGTADGGPSWIAAVVNAVGGYDNLGNKLPMQCNYWQNTVVLITWDDWGGWYDHVLPYRCSSSGLCRGYPNGTAWMYVYGFRVPLLVVSAYTPQGYVSGSPSQGGKVKPYIHDFGSILNFIEYVFGQNRQSLGTIGDPSYPYADYFAPDSYTSGCPKSKCPYSLSDFFNFGKPRTFQKITGAKYNDDYFLQPERHFSHYPMDPDNDGIDEESTDQN
jgi:phospholipase C